MLSATPLADVAVSTVEMTGTETPHEHMTPTQPLLPKAESSQHNSESHPLDPPTDSQQRQSARSDHAVRMELVFIDGAADDSQQLIADLLAEAGADPARELEIYLLETTRDGIDQISEILSSYRDVDAVHLVSHGAEGRIKLGDSWLTADNLDAYAGQVAGWNDSLRNGADLLIYGCDLAAGEEGRALIESIGALCDCDVAASDDDTGAAIFGGDWDLEYHTGVIDTGIVFTADVQQNWLHLLNVSVENTTTGTAGLGASSLVVAHNTSSSANRLMLVGVSFGEDKNDRVLSVDYDGQAMTLVGARDHSDSQQSRVEIWGLIAPNSGAGNVTVNFGPNPIEHQGVTVGVTTFAGVDQFEAWGSFASSTGDSNSPSTTVTSLPNEVVFGVMALSNSNNASISAGPGQSLLWDEFNEKANGAGSTEAGTASVVTSWNTGSAAGKWVAAGVSVKKLAAVVDTADDYDSGDSRYGDTASIDALLLDKGSDGLISLREAIDAAENTPGGDSIRFDIAGAGPHVINLIASPIQNIDQAIYIDGTSDPDQIVIDGGNQGFDGLVLANGSDNSLIAGLNIRNMGSGNGIKILSNGNTITGNYIGTDETGNTANATTDNVYGIWIESGSGNTIGGTAAGDRNVIGGNSAAGIYLKSASTSSIVGNYIGIGADGSSIIANVDGVYTESSSNNTIGGSTAAERNVISGNTYGLRLDSGSNSNTVAGNYIGTDAAGTSDKGNTEDGIWIVNGAMNNIIGGSTSSHRNVISGNDDDGIHIEGSGSSDNEVYNNYIGVNKDGDTPLGNSGEGIFVMDAPNTIIGTVGDGNLIGGNAKIGIKVAGGGATNTTIQSNYIGTNSSGANLGNQTHGIRFGSLDDQLNPIGAAMTATIGGTGAGAGNVIAYNLKDGVNIRNGTDFAILGNTIHSNTEQAIDLQPNGLTPNDSGVQDADNGANNLQNFPTISSAVATADGSSIDITFSLDSLAGTDFRIEFFENQNTESNGEAVQYLGFADVTTDGSGLVTNQVATISGYGSSLVNLDFVAATATEKNGANLLSTSELGANTIVEFKPAISVNGTRNFVEDGGPIFVDSTVTITDLDSPHFSGGSLVVDIDDANGTANDRLLINDETSGAGQIHLTGPNNIHYNGNATPFATYSGGSSDSDPLVITFINSNATQAAVDRLAENIQFNNTSHTPSTATRVVSFTLTDGDGHVSDTDTVNVTVQKTNDPPTGTVNIAGTPTEDQVLTASNSLNDLDGMGTVSYQWQRNGGDISGATGTTYTLDDADAGQMIRVEARYTDGEGNFHQVPSTAVGPITNINDAPILSTAQTLSFTTVSNATAPANNNGDSVLDLLLSGGGGNPITDADPGAVDGIAINQVDDSNGTWEFSTDGGLNWNPIDPDGSGPTTISNANALLLLADGAGMNRIRFNPDSAYVGSVTNFQFRAWDTTESPAVGNGGYADIDTLGTGGDKAFSLNQETASISVIDPFLFDQFNGGDYTGNDGTHDWVGDWIENDNASHSNGDIRVMGSNQLRVRANTSGEYIYREADLSNAATATLSFDSTNSLLTTGQVILEISNDGGGGWSTLKTYNSVNSGVTLESFDILAQAAINTQIRFRVAAVETGSNILVDNVRIDYTVAASNTAPTITSDGAGPTAAVNVAENNTAVTTVTATDSDLPAQTLSYSIIGGADAAEFNIDGVSGALTFAAAPDFETPSDADTDNVYEVTVQVSDGAGGSDTQSIAVSVQNAEEVDLWITTADDVGSPSGASGLDSWQAGEALSFDDPNLTFDPVGTPADTTDGTLASAFNLDDLVQGNDARLSGLHFVQTDITVGSGVNDFDLKVGDILFSTRDSEILQSNNILSVIDKDLTVFRPDTLGDYSVGTFTKLFDGIQIPEMTLGLHGVTLVETNTTVGSSVIPAGTFLLVDAANSDIFHYTATGVGAGTTSGTWTTLIDGSDINIGQFPRGLELLETTAEAGGSTLTAGTILLSLNVDDSTVGDNSISVQRQDIFALTVSKTEWDQPTTEADATLWFDGSDVGLNTANERIHGFTFGVTSSNQAPTITSDGGGPTAAVNVAENNTAVTTVTATDADLPAQTLSYSIIGGADAARFNIDGVSGALTFAAAPDFEAPTDADTDNVYEVTVQASDGAGGTDTQTISVTVTAVNDNNPVITSNGGAATAGVNVAENSSAVTTVTATDADLPAQTLSYSISGGVDAASFNIDAVSGALTFAAAPDFETPTDADTDNVYEVTVQASDGAGGTDTQAISVTVTAVNDNNPVITSNGGAATAGVNVAENSSAVTTVTATDADLPAQTLSYSIIGGTDAARFNIDAVSGALTFAAAPDFETPTDADTDNVYEVTVQASDGAGGTDTQTISVSVTAVNDNNPVITSNGGAATAAVNVAENSSAVTTVTATDADLPAQTLSYSISGGADAARFNIDGVSGELTFAAAPDFEAPTDADTDNVYEVTIQASDGAGGTDTQAISVTVTAVNDNNPVITSDGGGNAAAINVVHNNTAVTTVTATDNDQPTQTINYSIIGGADAAQFSINAGSGDLIFVTPPDFASPADANGDNIYHVTVQASDGLGGTDAQSISVTVTPAPNTNPVITSNGSGPTAAVNVTENSTAVTTVTATDADLPAQTLSYSISGGTDAARFNIDGVSGALTFAAAPDFESPTDADTDNVYEVTIQASDGAGGTDTQAISVTVTAVNDNNPVITSDGGGDAAAINVVHNNTAVTTVTASDNDQPTQTINYSISGGADAAQFSINAGSGNLTFVTPPDFASPADANGDNIYHVTVQASDGLGGTDAQNISVTVTPASNTNPVITSDGGAATAAVNVYENSSVVTTVTATDADLPAQTLSYSISGGADAAEFNIDAVSGALTFAAPPDFESPTDADTDNVYEVTVQASDGAGGTDTQTISVSVTAVNDNNPVITSNGGAATAAVNVAENSTAVTTVTATDADLPAQTLSYSIIGGSDAARFSIDGVSGALTFAAAPDFESPTDADTDNVYEVTVQASDGAGDTDTQAISVTVTAVNDNNPVITSNGGAATAGVNVAENSSAVTTVTATDADLPAQTLNYSISGGIDAARFNIDGVSGALTFAAAPDFETPTDADTDNVYEVSVQASDGAGGTDTQAISVTVTAVNDNNPAITSDGGGLTAAINTVENNSAVTTVTATDADLPAQTLSYSISGGADAARFNIDGVSGALTFAVAPDFESPTDADTDNVYEVTVQASDGAAGTDSQAVSVFVGNVNEAPAAADDTYSTSTSETLLIVAPGVLAGDTDPENDSLTVTLVAGPVQGSLLLNPDGSFTYIADAVFVGSESFTYQVDDLNGGTDTGVVTITITTKNSFVPPPNIIPPIEDPPPDTDPPPESDPPIESPTTVDDPIESSPVNIVPLLRPSDRSEGARVTPVANPVASVVIPPSAAVQPSYVFERTVSAAVARNVASVIVQTEPADPVATFAATLGITLSPDDMTQLQNTLQQNVFSQFYAAGAAATTGTALTAGYVLWAIRGGWLATSLLAQMPAWKMVDPLVILEYLDDDPAGPNASEEDDDSLESLLERSDRQREQESEPQMDSERAEDAVLQR